MAVLVAAGVTVSVPLAGPAVASAADGTPSPDAVASQQAQDTGKAVHVAADDEADPTTYANPDGTFATKFTQAPTRVATGSGWTPIDQSLTAVNGDLTPKASPVDVTVSGDGNGALGSVAVTAAGGTADVGLGWSTDLPDPSVSGATATYDAGAGTQVQVIATQSGYAQNVVLAAAPAAAPTYTFPLHLDGLTPSLDGGVLSYTDSAGTVVASSAPLRMWDAHRDQAGDPDPAHTAPVEAALVPFAGGTALQLSPAMSFLTDPGTTYPVTVDPTMSSTAGRNGDVTYTNDGSTADTSSDRLNVGKAPAAAAESQALVSFKTGRFAGRDVTAATMSLYQWDAGSCSPVVTTVAATTVKESSPFTWAHKPGTYPASEFTASPSFDTGDNNCTGQPNGFQNLDVTRIVAGWSAGELGGGHGLLLQAPAGSGTNPVYSKAFCSMNPSTVSTSVCKDQGAGPTRQPALSVTWNTALGVQSSYSMTTHRLNDRSSVSVNHENGNAVIQANDIHLKGRGLDLGLTRFYNGANTGDGQFGAGWSLSGGPDVQLAPATAGSVDRFDYVGPGGTRFGQFVRKTVSDGAGTDLNTFNNPAFGGLDADLIDLHDKTSTHHHYQLTFHASQQKYVFDNFGVDANPAVLSKVTDRNGNEIDYTYNTSGVWTSVTDTHARTLSVHHNSSGYVDSITDPSGRVWGYAYTGDTLTSYTDPTGAVTSYGWTSGQITTITDPAQTGGVHPKTTLTYSSAQLTALAYDRDGSGGTFQFTFSYTAAVDGSVRTANPRCNDAADTTNNTLANYSTDVTDVTDAQGGTTTYCYVDRDDTNAKDRILRVIDGLGHRRSSSFNPDQQGTSATSPTNDTAGASTVAAYNANNALTSVTEPKETSGDTAGTDYYKYNAGAGVAGSSYLPSSHTDAQGSCTAYGYDAKGNLSDSQAGLTPTGNDCAVSGAKKNHIDYNADGTPTDSYTPSGAPASVADETSYAYFTVEPNKGELRQVVRPGGNTTCTTDRTLCTSYTYDADSRAVTVTDGNAQTTTTSYDADDRVTQVLLAGTSTCDTAAGTCLAYTYDGEGNLTQRVDATGTTAFTYDRLNRLATETLPDTTVLTTTTDGAGNLTGYTQDLPAQAADPVTYAYNAANQLTGVTDTTGTYTITATDDGNRNSIAFPTSPAVTVTYGYTKAGRVKTITPSGGSGVNKITYTYNTGTSEKKKVQTMATNGVTTSYSYDSSGRVTSADASTGTDYTYTYDDDGNVKTVQTGAATAVSYGYNEADQLCWSGTTTGRHPDRPGLPGHPDRGHHLHLRQSRQQHRHRHRPDHRQRRQPGHQPHPTRRRHRRYPGLHRPRQRPARHRRQRHPHQRRPLGVTARTTTAGTTYYTRDPQGQVIGQHGTAGTGYYYTDRLSSTVALMGTSGTATTTFAYTPYGATTEPTGTSDTPWRWTGSYYDTEGDGYYHQGARYNDTLSHYTQPDSVIASIATPATTNLYTYASADPINNTDPTGRCDGFYDCAGQGAILGTIGGAILGGAIGGGSTAGIGLVPGIVLGAGEGAIAGTFIGGAVGLAQDIFG